MRETPIATNRSRLLASEPAAVIMTLRSLFNTTPRALHTYSMKTTQHLLAAAFIVSTAIFAAAPSATAGIVILNGGDAGEGYAPLSQFFGAVDFGGLGGMSVQGVAFTASNPNFTLSTTTNQAGIYPTAPFTVTTADDSSLLAIARTSVYNNPGPITLTIGGLTVGTLYQVDSFVGLDTTFSGRTESITATGAIVLNDSVAIGTGSTSLFDIRHLLAPDAAGNITMNYAATGFPAPNINAVSVTSVTSAVPEPTTALFGVALLGAVGMGRRRAKSA